MMYNVTDLDGDSITLKIKFICYLSCLTPLSAEAFDSKGRYFYAERFDNDLQYYIDKDKNSELNIFYDNDLNDTITIYLNDGERYGLVEQKDDDKHLRNFDKRIKKMKKKIKKNARNTEID